MKIALVTGATSGIGHEILKKLLEMGYTVYGLGRDFSKIDFSDKTNFFEVKCDLLNFSELQKTLENLKKVSFDLIVNSAGIGYFGLHEEINMIKLRDMITVNFQAPIIISQYFLRTLKKNKGTIINVSSITAKKESPLGAAYSATKAGLSHFGKNLFEEARKSGLKVVTLHPDMTKTDFYKNTFFECSDEDEGHIKVCDISATLEFILNQNTNIVITDVTIKTQKHLIKRKKERIN